jgi:hypothetical protein
LVDDRQPLLLKSFLCFFVTDEVEHFNLPHVMPVMVAVVTRVRSVVWNISFSALQKTLRFVAQVTDSCVIGGWNDGFLGLTECSDPLTGIVRYTREVGEPDFSLYRLW